MAKSRESSHSKPPKIIVAGASAGGVESLTELVKNLKQDFSPAILVVLHLPSNAPSLLASILQRITPLKVVSARDGMPIQGGHIYVASPGRHLLVNDGSVRLSTGPEINGVRPAIDPLFESASRWYPGQAVGIILSGTLSDGTMGAYSILQNGGVVLAQNPEEALFPSMPLSAIENNTGVQVMPVKQIAELLNAIGNDGVVVGENSAMSTTEENEFELIQNEVRSFEDGNNENTRSVITCPSCGGVLWEIHEGKLIRYRCHVGHIFSPEALIEEQSEQLETALWAAIRALVEKAALSNRIANRAMEHEQENRAQLYLRQAARAEQQADMLRELVTGRKEVEAEELPGEQATKESSEAQEDEIRGDSKGKPT